jgi:hypothetical protein
VRLNRPPPIASGLSVLGRPGRFLADLLNEVSAWHHRQLAPPSRAGEAIRQAGIRTLNMPQAA